MSIRCKELILFLTFPFILYPQSQDIKFERLSSYKALGSTLVRCIAQDDKGFMWFGTQNGLYRYDGYNFRAYVHDPSDPYSISYNWIHTICPEKSGSLWIGTYGGGLMSSQLAWRMTYSRPWTRTVLSLFLIPV